jgi:type VI secretion system protein ImpK
MHEHLLYEASLHESGPSGPTLCDLLEEGWCLLSLLRGGAWPRDAAAFRARLEGLLTAFEAQALRHGKGAGAGEAVYAFCALADEILLSGSSPLREDWERAPLQLTRYGDHLAGEGFFRRLERLRENPVDNREALEAFHACLLLGFQGRYLLQEPGALPWLTAQVGRELARIRGEEPAFAPHAEPAFRYPAPRHRRVPPWGYSLLLVMVALTIHHAFAYLLWCQTGAATRGAFSPLP